MKRFVCSILMFALLVYSTVNLMDDIYKRSHVEEEPKPVISLEPMIFEEEKVVEPRYGFTDEEIYLLAQLLCGSSEIDGDGEYDFVWSAKYSDINYGEISKVLCVVMNRVRSDLFPDNVTDVVMQEYPVRQFEVMPANANTIPDELAIEKVREWCKAYDNWVEGVQSIPEEHLYYCAGPNLTNVTNTHW